MVPVIPVSLFGAPLAAGQPSSSVAGMSSPFSGIQNTGAAVLDTPATAPFGDLLVESIGQVDRLEEQARTSVEGLMSGRGVDVHEAMIATEKAEMGFELVLSVRNKALAAYQQVMGMQF